MLKSKHKEDGSQKTKIWHRLYSGRPPEQESQQEAIDLHTGSEKGYTTRSQYTQGSTFHLEGGDDLQKGSKTFQEKLKAQKKGREEKKQEECLASTTPTTATGATGISSFNPNVAWTDY